MQLVNIGKRRAFQVVASLLLGCGGSLAIEAAINSSPSQAQGPNDSSQVVNVQKVVANSELLYESIQAPPPGAENTVTPPSESTTTSSSSTTSTTVTTTTGQNQTNLQSEGATELGHIDQTSDLATSAPGGTYLNDDPGASGVDRWNSTHTKGDISKNDSNEMLATANLLLPKYFTADEASQVISVVKTAIAGYQYGQVMCGGGGASVVNFGSVVVDGSSASAQAVVAEWMRLGFLINGQIDWQDEKADIQVNDLLEQQPDGTWLVSDRTWQFMPGNGPGGGSGDTPTGGVGDTTSQGSGGSSSTTSTSPSSTSTTSTSITTTSSSTPSL